MLMESKNLPNSNFGALEKHFINRHLIFILICKMWPYVTFVFAPNYEMYASYLVRISLFFGVLIILLLYWKAVLNDTKYSYATVFNIIPLTKSNYIDKIENDNNQYLTNITNKSNTILNSNVESKLKSKQV